MRPLPWHPKLPLVQGHPDVPCPPTFSILLVSEYFGDWALLLEVVPQCVQPRYIQTKHKLDLNWWEAIYSLWIPLNVNIHSHDTRNINMLLTECCPQPHWSVIKYTEYYLYYFSKIQKILNFKNYLASRVSDKGLQTCRKCKVLPRGLR